MQEDHFLKKLSFWPLKELFLILCCYNLHPLQSDIQHDNFLACDTYGKFSKNSNTFIFQFSNKMLLFRAGIHKMDIRIANREGPDQTASSEAV